MPRPNDVFPGALHTYGDWQALGYQVQRGEHHVSRDYNGRPLFSTDQVRPRANNYNAPPNPNAFRQRERRTRPREREEQPQQPVRNNLPRVDVRDLWRTGNSSYFTYDFHDVPAPSANTYRLNVEINAAPLTEVQEAERAYIAATQQQRHFERQHERKYVPADDESGNGFKKLSAIERELKERK